MHFRLFPALAGRVILAITFVGTALLFGACATNPVAKFYLERTPLTTPELFPYTGGTQIFSTTRGTIERDAGNLAARGYALLGFSNFWTTGQDRITEDKAIEQAKLIGADVVLFEGELTGTSQAVVPFLTVTPGQTSTTTYSGTANANIRSNTNTNYNTPYGNINAVSNTTAYGSANTTGTSTTTTAPVFNTQMIPVTVNRYDYQVLFFRKRFYIFGAQYDALPSELRQQLQRNTGLIVKVVVEGFSAYNANILIDDVLTTIDGETITTAEAFAQQLQARAGREVEIEVLRNGAPKTIKVKLGILPQKTAPAKVLTAS